MRDWGPEEPLFPWSASAYRRRWDALLAALGIPATLKLTPGGLRGGGAVFQYHLRAPIADLLWAMRLRHQDTLASYLQEVAALNVLPSLPASARRSVESAAAIFLAQLQSPPA